MWFLHIIGKNYFHVSDRARNLKYIQQMFTNALGMSQRNLNSDNVLQPCNKDSSLLLAACCFSFIWPSYEPCCCIISFSSGRHIFLSTHHLVFISSNETRTSNITEHTASVGVALQFTTAKTSLPHTYHRQASHVITSPARTAPPYNVGRIRLH